MSASVGQKALHCLKHSIRRKNEDGQLVTLPFRALVLTHRHHPLDDTDHLQAQLSSSISASLAVHSRGRHM